MNMRNRVGELIRERIMSDDFLELIASNKAPFDELMAYYRCAIMEIETKFNVLNEEFSLQYDRNPIESVKSRIKSTDSIVRKLRDRGLPFSLESIERSISDIAGVRVICSFPEDIYLLADCLLRQNDITLIERKDYIATPKDNGYRSLHLIVEVPIFLRSETRMMKVEVQLRTIAMDFWASLEHTLKYKQDAKVEGIDMFDELKDCSDIIQDVERRMQILMHAVQTSDVEEAARRRRAQIEEQEKVVAGVADAASGKPERAISSSTKTVTEAAVQRSISDAAAVREKTE